MDKCIKIDCLVLTSNNKAHVDTADNARQRIERSTRNGELTRITMLEGSRRGALTIANLE